MKDYQTKISLNIFDLLRELNLNFVLKFILVSFYYYMCMDVFHACLHLSCILGTFRDEKNIIFFESGVWIIVNHYVAAEI